MVHTCKSERGGRGLRSDEGTEETKLKGETKTTKHAHWNKLFGAHKTGAFWNKNLNHF